MHSYHTIFVNLWRPITNWGNPGMPNVRTGCAPPENNKQEYYWHCTKCTHLVTQWQKCPGKLDNNYRCYQPERTNVIMLNSWAIFKRSHSYTMVLVFNFRNVHVYGSVDSIFQHVHTCSMCLYMAGFQPSGR